MEYSRVGPLEGPPSASSQGGSFGTRSAEGDKTCVLTEPAEDAPEDVHETEQGRG